MLARVGLASPTKSLDSEDNINHRGHNPEVVGAHRRIGMCKLECSKGANLRSIGQQSLTLKKMQVRGKKKKSPLGKR